MPRDDFAAAPCPVAAAVDQGRDVGRQQDSLALAEREVAAANSTAKPFSNTALTHPRRTSAPGGRHQARHPHDRWRVQLAAADQDELRFVVAAHELEAAGMPPLGILVTGDCSLITL